MANGGGQVTRGWRASRAGGLFADQGKCKYSIVLGKRINSDFSEQIWIGGCQPLDKTLQIYVQGGLRLPRHLGLCENLRGPSGRKSESQSQGPGIYINVGVGSQNLTWQTTRLRSVGPRDRESRNNWLTA